MRKSLAFALFFLLAAASLSFALAPDRSRTATGTIAKIQASERAITIQLADGSESRFVWNADTKINGVLVTGARVTIRYDTAGDGTNLAQQISVARS
jgi:hypothetical protein